MVISDSSESKTGATLRFFGARSLIVIMSFGFTKTGLLKRPVSSEKKAFNGSIKMPHLNALNSHVLYHLKVKNKNYFFMLDKVDLKW